MPFVLIQVWHSSKASLSAAELTPLGEVYLPLKALTERYVEANYTLQWSPKMPLTFKTGA
jgi:hypothetical protein